MLQIILYARNDIRRVLRNIIIVSILLANCLHIVQSAELTLDISSYSYREVDQSDNFFMEDKSAPFLHGVGIRDWGDDKACLLYTSPSPRDVEESRMPSSA